MRWILQKTKLITLLCFSMYALSPVYAVLPADQGVAQHHTHIGILWLNIALDSFLEDDRTNNHGDGKQLAQASQDEDTVLIKKKRAVNNRYHLAQPLFKAGTAAIPSREPLSTRIATTLQDMHHRTSDGYYYVSTGLSPPLFLS